MHSSLEVQDKCARPLKSSQPAAATAAAATAQQQQQWQQRVLQREVEGGLLVPGAHERASGLRERDSTADKHTQTSGRQR